MTVAENVEYGLRSSAFKEERYASARRWRRSPPPSSARASRRSSRRQRQRVALARAPRHHPRVLLLDEPLGALDLKLREEMQIELKRIQQDVGITFIYVTHDQDEALTMSDRIAVFSHGRIDQVGTPMDVYEHRQTEFVAGFGGRLEHARAGRRRFTVRPEKIRLLAGATRLQRRRKRRSAGGGVSGLCDAVHRRSRRGRCAHRRQAERGRHERERGRPVQLAWRPEHTYVIEQRGEREGNE